MTAEPVDPIAESPSSGIVDVDARRHVFDETLGRSPSRGRMAGRTVLIVGGGQQPYLGTGPTPIGNGRAITTLLAREGAQVGVLDREADRAADTVDAVRAEGGQAEPIIADVAVPADIERAVDEVIATYGKLDGLVLSVGVGGVAGLAAQTPEAWDLSFTINLRSHMLFCRAALPKLEPGSSIVFISSTASLRPGGRMVSYEASKAAIAALSRHIALEGQDLGIRSNVLLPGPVDTPLLRNAVQNQPRPKRNLPFGREATAWEVAYGTLFLLSHEASFVNAEMLVVDGGLNGLQMR